MTVETIQNGTALTATVSGRIDTLTASTFEAEVKDRLAGVNSLTLDFAGVDYISSAGLRVLLSLEKIMGKKDGMVVKNINETVSEVFEVTGFSEILTIE